MIKSLLPSLTIGNLTSRLPIIQGGMGVGVSLSGLATAVANAGGIGVIAAAAIGMNEPDFNKDFKEANKRALSKEIRKAKAMSKGIIGVNIMLAHTDYAELVEVAVAEHVDIIFLGAGLLLHNPVKLKLQSDEGHQPKIIPIVSSARAAKIIFQSWAKNGNLLPDAIVVEGPKAGGHLGFKKDQIFNPDYQLEKIVVEVLKEIHVFEEQYNKTIPVIAAGGIFTGNDIFKFMKLGVQGVQMATRFVTTFECDAADAFKQSYLNCTKEDIAIIDSPVGMPGRAIQNSFLKDVAMGEQKPFNCSWKCLASCDYKKAPYCIAMALVNAFKGNLMDGFTFAGANAYLNDKIVSVKTLINNLIAEYQLAAQIG